MNWTPTRLKHLAISPLKNGLGEAAQDGDDAWPRYIRTTDIASSRSLDPAKRVTLPPVVASKALVRRDDLLMCAAGSLGKVYLHGSDEVACYAGYLVRFRPDTSVVDPRFVAYWAESRPFLDQIEAGAVRSTIDNFSARKYRELFLSVPSLEEQRRIADFLDEQVALLDRGVTLREKQRVLAVERFAAHRESVLLGISSTMLPVGNLLAMRVSDGPHETPDFLAEGVPFLSVDGVVDDRLDLVNCRYISEDAHRRYSQKVKPQRGDVLVTKAASIGKVAEVLEDTDFNVWSPLAILRPNTDRVVSSYLGHALRLLRVQSDLLLHSHNSTQNNLSMSALSRVRIPWVPVDQQVPLVDQLNADREQLRALDALLLKSLALLAERRQSVITAAVTGQFDVTTARSVA